MCQQGKKGVSVENREEGVRDRKRVIPESSIVQTKCFRLKRLILLLLDSW